MESLTLTFVYVYKTITKDIMYNFQQLYIRLQSHVKLPAVIVHLAEGLQLSLFLMTLSVRPGKVLRIDGCAVHEKYDVENQTGRSKPHCMCKHILHQSPRF